MADDPDKKPDEDDKPDPDAGAKKALEAERKARRDAEKRAADIEAQLKELTDKDKSEVDKLRDEVATLKRERDDARGASLRYEVAAEKGVKARWLTGSTREELEQAADEYLTDHPTQTGSGTPAPPARKPAADLRGGSEPDTAPTEMNPAKLAESVPRY